MRSAIAFLKDDRAATAVEFALVVPVLILTMVFVMVVGVIQYLNMELDYATSKAARQILTGSAQAAAATQATFTTALCGSLPAVMNCGDVNVNLYVVQKASNASGYYGFVKPDLSGLIVPAPGSGTGQFKLGVQGDYQYLLVVYPINALPAFVASLFGGTTYKGSAAYLAVSTAAFRIEQY